MFLSKAGGEGIDLKMTDNIYILEPTWTPAQLYQAVGRGVRLGSHTDAKGRGHVNAYCLSLSFSEEQYRLESSGPGRAKAIPKSVEDHLYDDILAGKFKELELFYSNFLPYSIGYGKYTSQNRPTFMKQNMETGYGIYNNNANPIFSKSIQTSAININKLKQARNNQIEQARNITYKLIDILQKLYPNQITPFSAAQRKRAMQVYRNKYGINFKT